MLVFEWDDAKARANAAKHGVTFEEAKTVFDDPFAIGLADDRFDYGEDRYLLIGGTQGQVFVVVYTERGDRIRLISARPANKVESDAYYSAER